MKTIPVAGIQQWYKKKFIGVFLERRKESSNKILTPGEIFADLTPT